MTRFAFNDPLDAEYWELLELAGPDGCKCGIPNCAGHEVIGGRIFMENHPLGPIIVECPDQPSDSTTSASTVEIKEGCKNESLQKN